jgi:RNA recognition motif-containing protein
MDQQNLFMQGNMSTMGYQDPRVLQQVQQQLKSQTTMKTDHILYVADLPDDTSEEDLFNFFKEYQIKAVKLISVFARSKAFITLSDKTMADKARRELNGTKLTAKYSKTKVPKPIRICKFETKQMQEAQSNESSYGKNLLIKNIPKEVSAHQFYKLFLNYGDIRSCKLVVNYKGESKGYGYVNFYRIEDAEKAKEEVSKTGVNNKPLLVVNLQKGLTRSKLKNNIYVKNIPKENFGDDELKKLFSTFGDIVSAVIVRDQNGASKGFAFVCFKDPQHAEKAYRELNNKKMFDVSGLPNLYVNFAMKKEERKEHLIKTRIEQLKQDQMMTIFAKVKDEYEVSTKEDFENELQKVCNFVKIQPKVVKINFVSKSAFLTMQSTKDAENFINIYSHYPMQILFFSIYKPKQDRIKANQFLQKAGIGQKKYKTYNQFDEGQMQGQQGGMMMPGGDKRGFYKTYNDPERMGMMPQQQPMPNRYNTYNNFPEQTPQQQVQQNIPVQEEYEGEDPEDFLAGRIYDFVEQYQPKLAGKITGMIKATGVKQMRDLLNNPNDLKNVIQEAIVLINKEKR